MSVKNIYHRTRDRIYKMNFSANGETSWSFTAEADGEIYSVESNNIDTYTVNGASITLPFSIEAGNTYSVSIIKTNTGEVADIVLKSRRSQEKITSQNVPDFQVGDGRYLYALNEAKDKVYKLDTSLLIGSNYDGSGGFTSPPVVSTITLPTLPNSIEWGKMCYIITDGVGKILVVSYPDLTDGAHYAIKILSDDNVYDLSENNIDSYSTLSRQAYDPNSTITQLLYDYVNNNVFFTTYSTWYINLNDNSIVSVDRTNRQQSSFFFSSNTASIWFNPVLEEFSRLSDFNFYDNLVQNKRVWGLTSDQCYYSKENNSYFHNTNNNSRDISEYDRRGNLIKRYKVGDYPGTTSYRMVGSDYMKQLITISGNLAAITIIDYSDQSSGGQLESTFNLRSIARGVTDVAVSNYISSFFFVDYSSDDGTRIRLHTFDKTGELSWFEFSENISQIVTNQLLV